MEPFFQAILLSLRIFLPGWLWCPRVSARDPSGRGAALLMEMAGSLFAGLIINLLPILALAPVNAWTPALDFGVWGLGVCLGVRRRWRSGMRRLNGAALVFASVFLLNFVIMRLPARSEWFAGGWDPGLYQNNAVQIARQNGIAARPSPVFEGMSPDEIALFSVSEGAYTEIFPGIPIDPGTGKLPFYFFHLTSLTGAWFFRMAGPGGLARLPQFLAWMSLPLFGGLCARIFKDIRAGWLGMFCGILSPLWWYHQAVPTSEMLSLFLVLGGWLQIFPSGGDPDTGGASRQTRVWVCLAFLLATVNHFNYPVLAGIFAVFWVWMHPELSRRRRREIVSVILFGTFLGVLWDVAFASVTLARLQEKDQAIWLVMLPFGACAVIANVLAARQPGAAARVLVHGLCRAVILVIIVCAAILLLLSLFPAVLDSAMRKSASLPLLPGILRQIRQTLYFQGAGTVLWALGGGVLLLSAGRPLHPSARAVILTLLAVLGLHLSHPGIAPIYPWALRRFFVALFPLLALLQTAFLHTLHVSRPAFGPVRLLIMAGIVIIGMLDGTRHTIRAARVGDYRGILDAVGNLRGYLRPDDLIVADDPRWGTPLMLLQGHHVVNGRAIWRAQDVPARQIRLATLQKLARNQNRRLVWLTGTGGALDIYGIDIPAVAPVVEGKIFEYDTVIHSARADHFAVRQNRAVFGVFVQDIQPDPSRSRSD